MTRVVIERTDGGVSIMNILEGGNVDKEIEKWSQSHQGQYVRHSLLKEEDHPTDRTFRDAWKMEGKKIEVDMPKAKEIHRNHIRRMRDPLFPELDVAFMRAQEVGDKKKEKEVTARKQELRDAPQYPAIEEAKTVEELKRAVPVILQGEK